MKNRLFLILLLIGLYHLAPVCLHANKFTIHIKLKDTTALRSVAAVDTSLALDRIFQYSPKFEERHRKAGLNLWYMVTVNDSARSANLMAAYKALPGVDKVDEDEKGFFSRAYEVTPVPASELRASEELPVNDPLYTQQWDLKNRVFPKAVDINIEKAWQIETGSSDVIVAIMDEPFDVSHEDLRANVWVNEKELNGKPEIDDDGNGYVDDIYGYGPSLRLGDHGTHVAGTIAAVNNNGKGVCGIAGGNGSKPGVKIMRCQMFSGRSAIQKAEAYIYAADNGAVISQNSWVNIDGDYNAVVLDGIKYFMEFAGQNEGAPMKGGLVVWGAGNDNHSRKISPNINPNLNKENLITVAAVVPDGDKASFSNYGDCIDIAAPGGEYNNWVPMNF